MNYENERALMLWEQEDLPSLAAVLRELAPNLAQKPIQHLNAVAAELIKKALTKFQQRCHVVSLNAFTAEHTAAFYKYTVSAFNAVLPLDYPYIIVLVLNEATNQIHPGTLSRKQIPGAHKLLRGDIVPILKLKGQKAFQPGDGVLLKKTELENSNANPEDDALEHMWEIS
jgi:hypothetical protein